ncbi:putative ubiquitin-conjugating enzyme E2 38 [Arachis ipaensis]|uniref:UBC core domain-containing protein n=1 Tax=Arachis hypogaea TaxID=3818 RepID=A0A445DLJ9_ARAHY|nr:putative ubiquitin-conjugating enzyme E2 38 [Arachis ipaensis]XP_025639989.1 putative ubiquitin-conjugating enzyme E2 38 [Arachis hypogaea]QHO60234.1 putative ubiquitin-conjugating enzyme E2 [Arachis hypogaea]RYR64114.1 hypothetical protein Ahy_A03g010255 isoform A [Arachis hypogaea]
MDLDSNAPNSAIKKRKQDEEDAIVGDNENSMNVGESSGSGDLCKSSTSGSLNSNNPNGSDDISCEDDEDMIDEGEMDEDPDYGSEVDYDEDYYDDVYSSMQDQFDNLPTGVEASLPWLKDIGSSECKQVGASEGSSSHGKAEAKDDIVMQKYRQFKQFDVVDSFPDHFFDKQGTSAAQRSKNWAKRIQEEWKILEENLPETVFVKVSESRMELLRAAIIGPQGTPYHDGLFFFDCFFPDNYPASPPKVHYHSGGVRINPNLYKCGTVCLSLLGTWQGRNNDENWIPGKSTMLQVLVSIQALILNEKPFYNEPGYPESYGGSRDGHRRSKEYSDNAFILSLKTMMYTMRKPPQHFEDLVAGHFRTRARDILTACKLYSEGAPVGSVVYNLGPTVSNSTAKNQKEFELAVHRMMNTLIAFFTKNGSTDCEEFRSPEILNMSAAANESLTECYNSVSGSAALTL